MKTDTPRTDKEQFDADGAYGNPLRWVNASFARELERENARLRDALIEAEPLLESAKLNTTTGEAAFFASCAEQARAALNPHPTRITPSGVPFVALRND